MISCSHWLLLVSGTRLQSHFNSRRLEQTLSLCNYIIRVSQTESEGRKKSNKMMPSDEGWLELAVV